MSFPIHILTSRVGGNVQRKINAMVSTSFNLCTVGLIRPVEFKHNTK
jgi:hypothetical protein